MKKSIILFISLAAFSCSSVKLTPTGCSDVNSQNYFIEKTINKNNVNNLTNADKLQLKQDLISQISSSVGKNSKVFLGISENQAYESYGEDVLITSFGYLNDPKISFCKRNKNYLVIISINKKDFIRQTKAQFENDIDINIQTISNSLTGFDSSKNTYNTQQAKKFNIKSQQLKSMHALVVNEKNYSRDNIAYFNNRLAKLVSLTAEFSKKSYVFDEQKTNINSKIENGLFKQAAADLNILLNLYSKNSIEGVEILSILKNLEYLVKMEWETNSATFYKNIRSDEINIARSVLNKLFSLTITNNYKNKFKKLNKLFNETQRASERKKLLAKSPKNQELFFGINATTSFGNIISSENSISLDSETSNFNLDKVLPSYKIGYKYYFNSLKRIGLFLQYKSNSNKFIEFSSSSESDYEFPFTTNFNEVQVGFSAGSLDFSFGKIINSMSVNNQEIEFNTASLNLSIITTDGSPKGEKNYFNLYGGINLISDFEDTNYMNFVIGLNYHIRFNRKLNKSDKTYLSKF